VNDREGKFLKLAIVVFIGQESFPQQAFKQSKDRGGEDRDYLLRNQFRERQRARLDHWLTD